MPLRSDDPLHARNTCCVFAPDGSLAARYDKIHLFCYDNGREHYDEARVLEAGSEPVAVQAGTLRVGLSICYDLRFPELYRRLCTPPCDLLSVPAAFTYTDRPRALGTVAARPRGREPVLRHRARRRAARMKTAAAPGATAWSSTPGARCSRVRPEGEGVVLAEVDPSRIASVRQQLPALAHRRL